MLQQYLSFEPKTPTKEIYRTQFHWVTWALPLVLSIGVTLVASLRLQADRDLLLALDAANKAETARIFSQYFAQSSADSAWFYLALIAVVVTVVHALTFINAGVRVTDRRIYIKPRTGSATKEMAIDDFAGYELRTSTMGERLGYADLVLKDKWDRSYTLSRVSHAEALAQCILTQSNERFFTRENEPWITVE